MSTIKESIVSNDGTVVSSKLADVPKPTPNDRQVLIKVVVSGSNPKDWKYPFFNKHPHNSGDDIAGIVESVGSKVVDFKKGDRVAAYHEIGAAHGSFAEYAIAEDYTTFHIPEAVSFEEASTIPLAALTAGFALFDSLQLPAPWNKPPAEPEPLLIYGASTSVGAFAVKLAKLAGIGPIIGVAGASSEFAKNIGVDYLVDYRTSKDIAAEIRSHLKPGQKLRYAFDGFSEQGSTLAVIKALEPGLDSKVALILPAEEGVDKTKTTVIQTLVAHSHGKNEYQHNFAYVLSRLFQKWLVEGKFKGHPFTVVEGGLAGVGKALQDLKDGKARATKYVFKIADTPGL
ncbi:chaperonin 10-like protein [Lipomyces japonicus]|uniref:chaperonin 10-like protein n=1 Tax=Lipomyces japonicus TaxID=56871 RepID=UPI0034CE56F5